MENQKKPKTLLVEFIEEKLKKYIEPTREGTPRGEPIGFSQKKYLATLWLMTNLKLKDIAKNVGVSYGLLRKWTTEKAFTDMVFDHYAEFTTWICGYIFKRVAVGSETEKDIKKKAFDELNKINPFEFRDKKHLETDTAIEKLNDAKDYNARLVFVILGYISDYLEKDLPKIADKELIIRFKVEFYTVARIIEHLTGKPQTEEERKKEIEFLNLVRSSMFDDVITILSRPKITADNRKEAIMILNSLKQILTNMKG